MTDESSPEQPESSAEPRRPLWLWPNLLSLDAPVVALLWMWLFAESFKVTIPQITYPILFLIVWTIYVGDRLFDASRLVNADKATARHQFYKNNFVVFVLLAAIAGGTALYLVLTELSEELVKRGISGLLLVALYFLFRATSANRSTYTPRELLCGIIFAFGTVLPVYVYAGDYNSILLTLHPLMFGLLCSLNCFLISWWERESDIANDDPASVTDVPDAGKYIRFAGITLALAALILRYLDFPNYGWAIHTAIFVSAAGLVILSKLENRLSKRALRVLADVVLLSPLIITPIVKASMER